MSTDGSRHVTGNDEPARNGKPSRFESSTISLQRAQVVERCLSLKTGTARPLASNTFTTSLNHSYRG